MSTVTFTKIQMPSAHMGKSADYPILFTGKRFYQDFLLDEDDELFLNYGYIQNGLPYTYQDSYDHAEEQQEFDAVILENAYLKATFLPGVGGKLWSLYDKKQKRDLIIDNPVYKPCNLAIRNAWTAGGVEWNCGVRGHHPLTCDNVFAGSYIGKDGTPVLRMYAFERIRAVVYQMDFYLPDDSEFLYARMRLVNGADRPVPIYWWSNMAVPQEEGARVIVPADEAYVNHAMDPVYKISLPMVNGIDQSYPTNHVETIDHFYKIPEESRKFQAHIRKDGTGIIHASTRRLKGRKMFVWGMSVGGQNWQRFLTNEKGQPYVEIQAGLAYTQNECLTFPPHTAWEWVETYGAIAIEPEKVHGDYRESRKNVERWLEEKLPEAQLYDFLAKTKADALTSVEPVHYGAAWGTLDNVMKESMGKRKIAPYLDFGEMGEEQMLWYRLLTTGKFDEPSPNEAPLSYMVQEEWFELLKKCIKDKDADNWYAWYHLGLGWFAREDYERAGECFERSLALKESTWGYHALANVAAANGDNTKASKLLMLAFDRNSKNVTIAKEAVHYAVLAKDYEAVKKIVGEMEGVCGRDGMLICNYAMALAHTGQLEEAKKIFEAYGDETVADRREGADGITDEYIYVLRELAKREGHPIADDADVDIPCHLDYRMYHTRML